jgi:hypothetical protein
LGFEVLVSRVKLEVRIRSLGAKKCCIGGEGFRGLRVESSGFKV